MSEDKPNGATWQTAHKPGLVRIDVVHDDGSENFTWVMSADDAIEIANAVLDSAARAKDAATAGLTN